ncbi:MAG: cyclase family protein, partial [Betaproteobacteria bacterium]|nr:cyclase family protein [Betaproteobacteria bacterium]
PLNLPGGNVLNPRRFPPRLSPTIRQSVPNWIYEVRREVDLATDVVNDDQVQLWLQYSTQWDSFAHVGALFDANADGIAEPVFYNGYRPEKSFFLRSTNPQGQAASTAADGPWESSAAALSVEHLAKHGMQGRGVLINLRDRLGDGRTVVGYERLQSLMDEQKVEVEAGDMLCIYTGFTDRIMQWAGQPDGKEVHHLCAALDGRDERLLQWISDCQISALIADNYAVEHYDGTKPPGPCATLPLHQHCLFKLGVPLGEIWYLHELALALTAQSRSRFLLTAPPLRLPGAVGSPATPIATL